MIQEMEQILQVTGHWLWTGWNGSWMTRSDLFTISDPWPKGSVPHLRSHYSVASVLPNGCDTRSRILYQKLSQLSGIMQVSCYSVVRFLRSADGSNGVMFRFGQIEDGSRRTFLKKKSNGHIFATGHPIHFMPVRPLYFALGQYTLLLTDMTGHRRLIKQRMAASRPTVWRERNKRADAKE